jgi:hypothetical protein
MRKIFKKLYYKALDLKLLVRRKFGKLFGRFYTYKNSYSFAMLCIKKTEYADMAIVNINSLLSLNQTHKFTLYCDTICAEYLQKNKDKLDYPDKVTILDKYGVTNKAWQYYKIEVHIEAAQSNMIDTDADGIWHDDPVLDRTKITMLAKAHNFSDMPNEVATLKNLFPNNPEWLAFRHCVAAFVSMPPKFMNQKVADDMRRINDTIFTHPFDFLSTEKDRGDARRLSEEFAVNLAIQSNHPQENLIVLKSEDGWGNKNILQSLYYGCGNQINE